MKKILSVFLISMLATSCINTNIGFRSVMTTTSQEASTEGMIMNQPQRGNSSVEAPKETRFKDSGNPTLKMKSSNSNDCSFVPEVGVKYIIVEPKTNNVPEPIVEE